MFDGGRSAAFFAALVTTLLVIWAGYAFTIDKLLTGIELAEFDRAGHPAYLFGEVRTTAGGGISPQRLR